MDSAASHWKVSGLYPEGSKEPQRALEQGTSMFRILDESLDWTGGLEARENNSGRGGSKWH